MRFYTQSSMHKRRVKTREPLGDRVAWWLALTVAVVATFVLDKPSEPHKWHAATMWFAVAFLTITLFGRTRWKSWRFWTLWTFFALLQLLAMWWLFGRVLPAGFFLGTLYVAPIGFIEGVLLVGLIVRIEHMIDPHLRA